MIIFISDSACSMITKFIFPPIFNTIWKIYLWFRVLKERCSSSCSRFALKFLKFVLSQKQLILETEGYLKEKNKKAFSTLGPFFRERKVCVRSYLPGKQKHQNKLSGTNIAHQYLNLQIQSKKAICAQQCLSSHCEPHLMSQAIPKDDLFD